MSFGWSVSDIALLVRLAYKTAEGARTACGEYHELTREVIGLHNVLNRLNQEARKPSSFLNRPGEAYKQELAPLSSRCRHVLTQLDTILIKYNALSERERSVKKLFKQVRFGTGAVANVADLRSKVTSCTASLSLFLNLVSLGTVGEVERKMNEAGGDLTDIKNALNGITARLSATAGRESSVLTAYTNDDKDAWRELRRGLVKDGFRGSLVRKHMKTIMAYVKELGSRGALDGFEELEYQEASYTPSRQDQIHGSRIEYQPTFFTTRKPKTPDFSNRTQPTLPEDDSMSVLSAASSECSSKADNEMGRRLSSHHEPYAESAYETESEDGHIDSPGTALSKDSSLHTSPSADDMMGQASSDVDPNIRDLQSLAIGEELSQQDEADQRKHKQENNRPGSADALTTSDTKLAHTTSKVAFVATGRKDESDWSWSYLIDPCRSVRIKLYQMSLDDYRIPAFLVDHTAIHTFLNDPVFNETQRRRALSAVIQFKARALRISRPNLPDRETLLTIVAKDCYLPYPGTSISRSEFRILDGFIISCQRLLIRLGQSFRGPEVFRIDMTNTVSRTILPEQINALCVAFILRLIVYLEHLSGLSDPKFIRSLDISSPSSYVSVVQDVEEWVFSFDRDCIEIAKRFKNMPHRNRRYIREDFDCS